MTALLLALMTLVALEPQATGKPDSRPEPAAPLVDTSQPHEGPATDPWLPRPAAPPPGVRTGRTLWTRNGFTSVQVNVDELGNNIPGDAANEPSIAIDLTSPNRMAIGWRQFDTVQSNFRQAGWAHTTNAGLTWTFPGVLEPGVFRSDPVLEFDADGNFYYYSLTTSGGFCCDVWKSTDGGVTWLPPVFAFGGDKEWFTIDRTDGPGHGNVYAMWTLSFACTSGSFTRSTNGGASFQGPLTIPSAPQWGTMSVGPDGALYVVGDGLIMARSSSAQHAGQTPVFELVTSVDLGGTLLGWGGPNPGGLLGQAWIATDHSGGTYHGNVYALASVSGVGVDPLDVMFARSTDGGQTWSEPVRVNDDPVTNGAWQWFGTMSVAPNGRIDAIWNDTRNTGEVNLSELFYASSMDGGLSWSQNVAVSPEFDSHFGWPSQNKIGDYYDMVSDNAGANVAYSATFNNEQDVYYLRLGASLDCNDNGIPDSEDIASGHSDDCNDNLFPDECEPDCNDNNVADQCDVTSGSSDDCNGNVVPDECDPDFDGDGAVDGCDPDTDGDGVPNEDDLCDFTPPGSPINANGRHVSDTNANCRIDLRDYERFLVCLLAGGPDNESSSATCLNAFDLDGDQDVDLEDFDSFQTWFSQ